MRIGLAVILLLFAAVLGLSELVALFDPVGTKMSDDADPFGDSEVHWSTHATYFALIFMSLAGAVLLLRKKDRD